MKTAFDIAPVLDRGWGYDPYVSYLIGRIRAGRPALECLFDSNSLFLRSGQDTELQRYAAKKRELTDAEWAAWRADEAKRKAAAVAVYREQQAAREAAEAERERERQAWRAQRAERERIALERGQEWAAAEREEREEREAVRLAAREAIRQEQVEAKRQALAREKEWRAAERERVWKQWKAKRTATKQERDAYREQIKQEWAAHRAATPHSRTALGRRARTDDYPVRIPEAGWWRKQGNDVVVAVMLQGHNKSDVLVGPEGAGVWIAKFQIKLVKNYLNGLHELTLDGAFAKQMGFCHGEPARWAS